MATCSEKTEWGRCQQPEREGLDGLCSYHWRAQQDSSYRRDAFYEEKIVKGLTEPTDQYISGSEMDALFRGRPRNDGRRIDAWTRR